MKCPICGCEYTDAPAISRTDGVTEICPECGIRQALESIGVRREEWDPIIEIVRAFERRKKIHLIKGE